MSFTYNDEGIRTSKTVDGVVTTYYLEGSRIIAEETAGNVTVYFYDTVGSVLGMRYLPSGTSTWQIYWFEHNLQGDVVAVYDASGTKLVSYTYDAWGNTTVTQHATSIPTPVQNNPYRYRGYYFDIDLNLYYLNARYYDQVTGRFINADDSLYHSMIGYNMFVYCNNNPVMNSDPTGESAVGVISKWLSALVPIAALEPTPALEFILVAGVVVLGVAIAVEELEKIAEGFDIVKKDYKLESLPMSISKEDVDTEAASIKEIKSKEEVDPYRRAGQKKRGGELKNKARRDDKFKDRSNKRHGRDKPKKHTPAKDHQKKFDVVNKIRIFK